MSSDFLVNAFQVPNALVDKAMRHLNGSELKCYLLIVRKTLGWHKKVDRISISQFMEDTGLSNRVVIAACENLTKYKLIECTKDENGNKFFSVNFCRLDTYDEKSHVTKSHTPYDEKSQVTYDEKSHTKDTIKNTIQKTLDSSPDEKPKAKREKFDPLSVELPAGLKPELWAEYVEMRKEKKKPLTTERMVKGIFNQLAKFADQNASLEQSINNSWQGVFEVKTGYAQPHPYQPALSNNGYVAPPPVAPVPLTQSGRGQAADFLNQLKGTAK